MVFGWQISPTWELILGLGLVACFTCYFYMIFFGFGSFTKSIWSELQQYEKAWWNQRVVLRTVFALFLAMMAPLSATAVLVFFFQGLQVAWGFLDLAHNHPPLLFFWVAITVPIFSFVTVWLFLSTMTPSKSGMWLANHFTQAFVVTTLSLVAIQSYVLFVALKRL